MGKDLVVYTGTNVTSRPRNNLTYDESVVFVERILKLAEEEGFGEDDIRDALDEIGFDGESANIDDCGEAGFKVRVWGPDDRAISLMTE